MTPEEFIAAIGPAAQESAKTSTIPASFTVAEAALESGWGAHAPGMNLFGVKADMSWSGKTTTQRTREYVNGRPVVVNAAFRAYDDWLGSISDHAAFLMGNPRYRPAFAYSTDAETFAKTIASCGYATDPNYANEIISIMWTHNLAALDQTSS